MKQKNRTFRKLLSLTLCMMMVLGTVAVGSGGLSELLDNFAVNANAEETGYKAGDSIYLGKYPQSEITDITGLTKDVDYVTVNNKYYAYEPIEWKVLDADTGLCVSNYALNAMAFESDSNDYADSDVRAWLYGADGTGTFYTKAFTDTEKTAIIQKDIATYKYNSDTDVASTLTDKVFLLSVEEASNTKYFAKDEDRICYPTDYAIANGAYTDSDYNNSCNWWLRSPGYYSTNAASVISYGGVSSFGNYVYDDSDCVRPVLYLNLKSEIFKSEITLNANNGTDEPIKNTVTNFKSYYPECTFTNGTKTFCGWYKDAECQQPWSEIDTVIGNMTLYAGWKANVPKLRINEESNMWEVSYDDGATWEPLGVKATGEDGSDGSNGADGVGIANIEKTDTDGNVDTYTITLTNNKTYTFTVTNGTDGKDGEKGDKGDTGAQGEAGKDGKDAATIAAMHFNENGELIVEMSDGTFYNAGKPTAQQDDEDTEPDPEPEEESFFRKIINFFKSIFAVIKSWF